MGLMGCDIHMYKEMYKDGKWVNESQSSVIEQEDEYYTYSTLSIDEVGLNRNYWLFGLLAEVRSVFPYSFQAKGLPDNISPEVKKMADSWNRDGHSHSYLTVLELQNKATELLLENPNPQISDQITMIKEIISQFIYKDKESQRIVFWFDN